MFPVHERGNTDKQNGFGESDMNPLHQCARSFSRIQFCRLRAAACFRNNFVYNTSGNKESDTV
jgi:hypothetical protein